MEYHGIKVFQLSQSISTLQLHVLWRMLQLQSAAVRGVCSLSIHRVTGNYRAMVLFARFSVLLPSSPQCKPSLCRGETCQIISSFQFDFSGNSDGAKQHKGAGRCVCTAWVINQENIYLRFKNICCCRSLRDLRSYSFVSDPKIGSGHLLRAEQWAQSRAHWALRYHNARLWIGFGFNECSACSDKAKLDDTVVSCRICPFL